MGNSQACSIKESNQGLVSYNGKDLKWASSSMKGYRSYQEDKIFTWSSDDVHVFAVLDGHRGEECVTNLYDMLPEMLGGIQWNTDFNCVQNEITQAFHDMDSKLQNIQIHCDSGTTFTGVVFCAVGVIAINCGDSRTVCYQESDTFETVDHKPVLDCDRIRTAGGEIYNGRINSKLAVSRAFGDYDYKNNANLNMVQQLVICTPDITLLQDFKYIVIGSDGLWDVLNAKQTSTFLKCWSKKLELHMACNELLDEALETSKDNISVIVISDELKTDPGCVSNHNKCVAELQDLVAYEFAQNENIALANIPLPDDMQCRIYRQIVKRQIKHLRDKKAGIIKKLQL